MPGIDLSVRALLLQLQTTSLAEWIAVAMGVVYVLLIMRRNRWGWVAGGVSSLILTVLAARARLPMQAVLQFSYVVASIYGWWRWAPDAEQQRIDTWNWKGHTFAVIVSLAASLALARLLAREGYSAWPFLDSLVTCLGLFATWLVARVYLENWIYWIVIDAVSVYLFLSQGLVVTAVLFCAYLVIATVGLRSWWQNYRRAATT
jgi:nicotinamide mononucleotide transporter